MRKVMISLMLFSLVFMLLACQNVTTNGTGNNTNIEVTTVTLAHWDAAGSIEAAVLNTVIESFEAANPDINVEVEILSDYENQMGRVMATGNVQDIILVPDGKFGEWVRTGILENLTSYVNASGGDILDLPISAVSRYMYDGTSLGKGDYYAIPKDVSSQVMFVNLDLFAEFGVTLPDETVPMDIYDAREMWMAFADLDENDQPTNDHIYGVAKLDPEGLVWSNGGDFLNASRTAATLTDDAVIEAYGFLVDAINEDYIIPNGTFLSGSNPKALFVQQKAASFVGGRWEVTSFRAINDFNWDVYPIPSFSDYPEVNGWSGSVGYGIFTDSEVKDQAFRVIEYIASRQGQQVMAETGFSVPMYNDEESISVFLAAEEGKLPVNTGLFIHAAQYQPAGLWQYLPGTRWKLRLDEGSAIMFDENMSSRLTASEFLYGINDEITKIIETDYPYLFD
jgi:multiple sugar transport system substrate-binding protein